MRKHSFLFFSVCVVLSASLAAFTTELSPSGGEGKLRVIELKGTPYQRGQTHGQSLKSEIQEIIKRWKADLEKTYSVPATTFIEKLVEAPGFEPPIDRCIPG